MSSPTVRSAARSMATDASWPVWLPFYETVNMEYDRETVNDLTAWCTLRFDASGRPRGAIGTGKWIEDGEIALMPENDNLGMAFDASTNASVVVGQRDGQAFVWSE